jgi:hypothetical protein
MVRGMPSVGNLGRVMRVMRVMLDICVLAAQRLRYGRGDHAQQDRKHPEQGPDLLTVAAEHDGPAGHREKWYADNLRQFVPLFHQAKSWYEAWPTLLSKSTRGT